MEATASILAPSPPNPPGGQIQTSRTTGDDSSFAPALSQAVANRNKNDGAGSGKSSVTPKSVRQVHRPTKKNTASTIDPKERNAGVPKKEAHSVSQTDQTSDKGSTDTLASQPPPSVGGSNSETDTATAAKSNGGESSSQLMLGTSGYLFTLPETSSLSDLQKSIATLPDALTSGKLDELNMLKDIKNLNSNTISPNGADSSSPGAQDFLTILQDSIGQTLNPANGDKDKTSNLTTALQDQTGIPSSPQTSNSLQQDSLITQQLQKLLDASGANNSIIFQQSGSPNKTLGLDSLSTPLLANIISASDQQATSSTDASNTVLTASLATVSFDKVLTSGKNTDKPSSTLADNLQFPVPKVDPQDQKDSAKAQEKDATQHDNTGQQQPSILSASPSTDSTGSTQQGGQFSFGSALFDNLQTGQHTTGTGSASYQLPWTPSQENNLINQVTQHLQINSSSPASQIVLKLYPEELGELKIDIQLKEGVIRASIVAQSEQVQQVLEKYMPKLKSFMEQQGLTVDSILVSSKSDNEGKQDLFQRDFTDSQNFSQQGKSTKPNPFSDLSFATTFSEKNDAISGVNVTV